MSHKKSGNRDHYIPRFYLRKWAEGEFLWSATWVRHKKELYWKRKATKAIGCKPGLYKELEKKFFEPLDTKTDTFVKVFSNYGGGIPQKQELSEKDAELWAKYILAQHVRVPENVEFLSKKFVEKGFDEETATKQLPEIISSAKAVRDLRNMLWVFATVQTNKELITSDNPLIFKPNNLAHKNCVVILPMAPNAFFLATHRSNYGMLEKDPEKMVSAINKEVLMRARDRIFTRSKNSVSDEFIKSHWSVCT